MESNLTTEERIAAAKTVVEKAVASHGEVDEERRAVFQRYCHVYVKGELETLIEETIANEGINACIIESYHDTGNWAVCKKIKYEDIDDSA